MMKRGIIFLMASFMCFSFLLLCACTSTKVEEQVVAFEQAKQFEEEQRQQEITWLNEIRYELDTNSTSICVNPNASESLLKHPICLMCRSKLENRNDYCLVHILKFGDPKNDQVFVLCKDCYNNFKSIVEEVDQLEIQAKMQAMQQQQTR